MASDSFLPWSPYPMPPVYPFQKMVEKADLERACEVAQVLLRLANAVPGWEHAVEWASHYEKTYGKKIRDRQSLTTGQMEDRNAFLEAGLIERLKDQAAEDLVAPSARGRLNSLTPKPLPPGGLAEVFRGVKPGDGEIPESIRNAEPVEPATGERCCDGK